ncbi:acyl-CoA thioesterase [Acetobacter sp. TBRC 12305]|uniref:Acyl-CoA thioesterase n=1 Tax=Acetobacter garciniae TaxID=2817435 RepID=A0A939KRG7_9PROT|nr:hotdog domain-containing protein [Acetobacter garciniae]MBO1325076.1 acyl-CoA thioesterase [Acetobacter garciniae]MBX0344953.1 acyl-CoA thioesterase [Acetobacter garciniae]
MPEQTTGFLAVRTMPLNGDTNALGTVFGGWIMAQMDIAAGIYAASLTEGLVTTVAVREMVFHKPGRAGQVISVYASLLRWGRTSVTLDLVMQASSANPDRHERIASAIFTMVALDAQGKPKVLPARDATQPPAE